MGKWSNLTGAVAAVIRANGNREITGQVLQNALLNIISNLGNFASFAGVATPSTNPGTPDGPVYYFATQAGTYTNFGALVLDGSCYVLYWNGTAWSSTNLGLATMTEVTSTMNSLIAAETSRAQAKEAELQEAVDPLTGLSRFDLNADGVVAISFEEGIEYTIYNDGTSTRGFATRVNADDSAAVDGYFQIEAGSSHTFTASGNANYLRANGKCTGRVVGKSVRSELDRLQSSVTSLDAEVTQASTDAGQARADATDVKSLFQAQPSVNKYDWSQDANLAPNQPRDSNQYIPIESGDDYVVMSCGEDPATSVYGNFTKVYCYDSSKELLQEVTTFDAFFNASSYARQGRGFAVPSGTAFIRLRYHFGRIDRETVMVEMFGSKPSYQELSQSYIAYGDTYSLKELEGYQKIGDIPLIRPKIQNPSVRYSANLRILDIGNSFTEDPVWFVQYLVTAAGIDVSNMCLYTAVRGSGSFKTWYEMYKGTDAASYRIRRRFGGASQSFVDSGNVTDSGASFKAALNDNKWDIIVIHQVSDYSCDYPLWEGNGAGGYLKEFVRLLKMTQPQATIAMYMPHISWNQAGGDTQRLWNKMVDTTKQASANYGIDLIVPIASAVEMVRASTANTTSKGMSRDGHHLANGLGRYTASCCYFQAILSPMFGVSIVGNSALWEDPQIEGDEAEIIPVTALNAPVAQKAALFACSDFYSLVDVDATTL